MSNIYKRAMIHLTKDDLRMIEFIKKELDETMSGAFKRCLVYYYFNLKNELDKSLTRNKKHEIT